jgi:Kdo2-lipid IVA lauroyltransferase/acyltransferase
MARFYVASALYDRLPRSPAVDRAAWWLEAALPRALWWLSRALPTDAASAVGGLLGGAIGPRLRKQRVILRNLEIALPDVDDRARRKIAREIWAEAGRVIAEFALLDRICGSEAADRLEIVLGHDLAPARTGARPAMFVTAHLSNSELAVTAATRNGVPLSIVSTPQSNPLVQAALERFRRVLGCRYLPSRGGLRQLIREVADGRSLGWITDQRHDRGELLPFFGVGAATATMPALLALRLNCDLVPARVERLHGCRFRITTYAPLSPAGLEHLPQQEAARELTRRLNTLFEQWIYECPGQWLCFKRRWRKAAQPLRQLAGETV